jgi:signal transduction histidine kinase
MKQPPPSFESGVGSFGLAVARQYLASEGIEAKPSPDPSEINFVLRNLIANACDALKEREKQQLDDFNPSIKLITKKLAEKIQIIIQDNGVGIDPKEESEIFKIYFTTKQPGKGTGLGLFTSQQFIVGRYGGKLYYQGVETDKERVKQFVVEIPT